MSLSGLAPENESLVELAPNNLYSLLLGPRFHIQLTLRPVNIGCIFLACKTAGTTGDTGHEGLMPGVTSVLRATSDMRFIQGNSAHIESYLAFASPTERNTNAYTENSIYGGVGSLVEWTF